MQFEGAYYTNLARRPFRDNFLRSSLLCQDFAPDKIFRIEGIDAAQFETDEEALEACVKLYPEMSQSDLLRKDPDGYPGKADICIIALWKNILTRIYTDLTDIGVALYLHDDILIRKAFWEFRNLIDCFNGNVDIVQLFDFEDPDFPSYPLIDSCICKDLLAGIVNPGDSALLLTKKGAKNMLDVSFEDSRVFPEMLFYYHLEKFQNLYTVRHSYLWTGGMPFEYSNSDRINGNEI